MEKINIAVNKRVLCDFSPRNFVTNKKNEPPFGDSLNLNQGTILQYKSVYLVTVL